MLLLYRNFEVLKHFSILVIEKPGLKISRKKQRSHLGFPISQNMGLFFRNPMEVEIYMLKNLHISEKHIKDSDHRIRVQEEAGLHLGCHLKSLFDL